MVTFMAISQTKRRLEERRTSAVRGKYRSVQALLLAAVTLAALVLPGCSDTPCPDQPPATAIRPVTDTYHETEVTEDYRWLEDYGDQEVQEWTEQQNVYARCYLDRLEDRQAIQERLEQLMAHESPGYKSLVYTDTLLFALKSQPPKEQSLLVVMRSADDPTGEHVILDLNEYDTTALTTIDFFVPSPDARHVAVSLSRSGSELGDVYVFDVATGEPLDDMVPRVNGPTAGGDVAWNADASGFYYTHYPRKGERPDEDLSFFQQVYFHRIGSPTDEDTYEIGKEFPRIAEIELDVSNDRQLVLATVSNGDGGEYAHYLREPSGRWAQITQFSDMIPSVKLAPDNALFMLSYRDAMLGKILRLAPGKTSLKNARTVVPESDVAIQKFLPTESRLYTIDLVGGPKQIRIFDHKGKQAGDIPLEPVSSVWSLVPIEGDAILYRATSNTQPPAWFHYDPRTGSSTRTALFETSPAVFDDIEIVRKFAISKDGTRIPMTIRQTKGTTLDGGNPVILYGYGGYGISQSPYFDAERRLWFDHGGIYVTANIRGGGEYGEAWHQAGYLTNKQNVFDDFIACAEFLIDSGYTTPERLGIRGGSNGGLLMGAVMTQRPELFRAVVSRAGVYDMLRTELEPNGVFNITEFGTVEHIDQFKALYGYSPYHRVVDGTSYPAVLFTAGIHDGRVDPLQSRKMIARLQAATTSPHPVLLRTSSTTGHGKGTGLSEQIETATDVWAFTFDQLSVRFQPED